MGLKRGKKRIKEKKPFLPKTAVLLSEWYNYSGSETQITREPRGRFHQHFTWKGG